LAGNLVRPPTNSCGCLTSCLTSWACSVGARCHCSNLEIDRAGLIKSVCISRGPCGQLLQRLDAEEIALHLYLVTIRCEGLENDPNEAITNNNSDSLIDDESLINDDQGKVRSYSSTRESGPMSHGIMSLSSNLREGEGPCHPRVSNTEVHRTPLYFNPVPRLALARPHPMFRHMLKIKVASGIE
jgi:hypothetical protein